MGTFQYEAMNAAGQEVKAEIEAGTADEAIVKIRSQGYFPTKVKEKAAKKSKGGAAAASSGSAKKKGGMSFGFGGVSKKVITNFTRQLSTLQDAGLPILRSLKILWQQQKPGTLKNVLDGVSNDVESGATLSEAMARHPNAFDKLYTNMVQAGETGGVLDVILQRLAEFMEKAERLKRRVVGAMIYPSVVVSFSVLIVTGIMIFVVPKFRDIFKDFHTTLPALTQFLMDMSDWIAADYGWAEIFGSPFLVFFGIKFTNKTKGGRRMIDRIKLKLPILGQIISKTSVARFTRTLGTLLSAGVPILDALNITRDTVGNVVFENALQKVHDAIREGESFAGPLRQAKVVDSIVSNMIDVGEETGDLDKMLVKIADNYDEEVDVLVGSLVSLLEPIMVVTLGGIVGTIVVALFLPLVKLIQSVSGGDSGGSGDGG